MVKLRVKPDCPRCSRCEHWRKVPTYVRSTAAGDCGLHRFVTVDSYVCEEFAPAPAPDPVGLAAGESGRVARTRTESGRVGLAHIDESPGQKGKTGGFAGNERTKATR